MARPSKCWSRGAPQTAIVAKTSEVTCAPLDLREVARVEARIRKDFVIDETPSKLVVDFGCAPSSRTPTEVVLETGDGHGGVLSMTRLRRDGDRWFFRRIASSRRYAQYFGLKTGTVEAKKLDPLLATAGVALVAKPHLVRLFDPMSTTMGPLTRRFSSHDIHLRLTLTTEDGSVLDRQFSGYEHTSGTDGEVLPMQIAANPIVALLDQAKTIEAPFDDDIRAFYTDRFLAMLRSQHAWWVKEHFVELAGELGTMDVVPGLVALANEERGDASVERTRDAALTAIAAITGWDPREGNRSSTEAAKLAAEECRLAK